MSVAIVNGAPSQAASTMEACFLVPEGACGGPTPPPHVSGPDHLLQGSKSPFCPHKQTNVSRLLGTRAHRPLALPVANSHAEARKSWRQAPNNAHARRFSHARRAATGSSRREHPPPHTEGKKALLLQLLLLLQLMLFFVCLFRFSLCVVFCSSSYVTFLLTYVALRCLSAST